MAEIDDNLSIVIYGKHDIRLEHTLIPKKLDPNECLLQTHSCGICGSDMHLYEDGSILDFVVKEPVVLGHEICAKVVKVGASVTKLKAGDRVAVEPVLVCLKCDLCRAGRYNLCQSVTGILGCPPHNGGQRKYFTHVADFCHKIADNMSYEEGALIEPLAVAVHAMKRVRLSVGDNVLICGSGTIGLLCMSCAKAFGANQVFITDINPKRLELAAKLGANHTYLVEAQHTLNEYEFAQKIAKDMQHTVDIAIDCTGNESSVALAMYATKVGGKVCIVGIGKSRMTVPIVYAALREIDIIGCFLYKDTFPLAIHLVSSGKVDVKPLITHKFKVKHFMKAFELMKSGTESSVKILIQHKF